MSQHVASTGGVHRPPLSDAARSRRRFVAAILVLSAIMLVTVGGITVHIVAEREAAASWAQWRVALGDHAAEHARLAAEMARLADLGDTQGSLRVNSELLASYESTVTWLTAHQPHACYARGHAAMVDVFEAAAETRRAWREWNADGGNRQAESRYRETVFHFDVVLQAAEPELWNSRC